MSCADAPGSRAQRIVVALGRRLLVGSLLSQFDKDAIRRKLRIALSFRSRDRNMSETELGRMQKLIEKEAL